MKILKPILILQTLFLLLNASFVIARTLPKPELTPGVINPDVTQGNIDQTICVSGWTNTIRPHTSYTRKLKEQQIKEYRYKGKNLGSYEEDHLISLQLGGHPTDPKNLWPEPYNVRCGARVKDTIESYLKRQVCKGKITLAQAQKEISKNWIAAYKKYINGEGCPPLEYEQ